jgi:hypothetical protein
MTRGTKERTHTFWPEAPPRVSNAVGAGKCVSSIAIPSPYAAGIGVMFLLFSMAGAAGSLLEEEETGTLERVLTSNVGMTNFGTMLPPSADIVRITTVEMPLS